jgi:molecular chaperone DnaK (HSP70)
LVARVLEWTVETVREREATEPGRTVVAHPANWGPYKFDLFAQAARLAGTKIDRYVTEPEAAALSYAHREDVPNGTVVAVYDLGGGTFDSCVLRKVDAGFDLLGGPAGIAQLGGIDFDEAVLALVVGALGRSIESAHRHDVEGLIALEGLRRECVDAKEALSTASDTIVRVRLPKARAEVRITRDELDTVLRPALEESVVALRQAVRSSGLTVEEIDVALLVGGSARIPLVERLVRHVLGRRTCVGFCSEPMVALGAAIAAGSGR